MFLASGFAIYKWDKGLYPEGQDKFNASLDGDGKNITNVEHVRFLHP